VTYLEHELRDLDRVACRAVTRRQKVRRTLRRIRNVVLVVRTVKILPVPARRVQDIRADAAGARLRREPLKVELCIRARRRVVPAEVRPRVAPEAALHLVLLGPTHGVADEHYERRTKSAL
jgi:hypothetical protein